MIAYYKLLEDLKDHFSTEVSTNNVHEGGFFKVDNRKETIFPIANIDVMDVIFNEHTYTFKVQFIVADILDDVSENETDVNNLFNGADNLQDIYNTQLTVINNLQTSLRRGSLDKLGYVLLDENGVSTKPFEQRFDNLLVGWVAEIDIEVSNDEVSIC